MGRGRDFPTQSACDVGDRDVQSAGDVGDSLLRGLQKPGLPLESLFYFTKEYYIRLYYVML